MPLCMCDEMAGSVSSVAGLGGCAEVEIKACVVKGNCVVRETLWGSFIRFIEPPYRFSVLIVA